MRTRGRYVCQMKRKRKLFFNQLSWTNTFEREAFTVAQEFISAAEGFPNLNCSQASRRCWLPDPALANVSGKESRGSCVPDGGDAIALSVSLAVRVLHLPSHKSLVSRRLPKGRPTFHVTLATAMGPVHLHFHPCLVVEACGMPRRAIFNDAYQVQDSFGFAKLMFVLARVVPGQERKPNSTLTDSCPDPARTLRSLTRI